jgi:hypothetical protein
MLAMHDAKVLELSREEIVERIERAARARRGMSATAILRAYRHGTLEDPGAVADILVLADLLSENDPIFGAAA